MTIYGNRTAFVSFAEWMQWIAASPRGEHYEAHLVMDLEDDASKFEGKYPRNVWTLVDPALRAAGVITPVDPRDFEITFMAAEDSELDQMEAHQEAGLLPKEWFQNREE